MIDKWNALPVCPAAFPCLAGGNPSTRPGQHQLLQSIQLSRLPLAEAIQIQGRNRPQPHRRSVQYLQRDKHSRDQQQQLSRTQHLYRALPTGAERSTRTDSPVKLLLRGHHRRRVLWLRRPQGVPARGTSNLLTPALEDKLLAGRPDQ